MVSTFDDVVSECDSRPKQAIQGVSELRRERFRNNRGRSWSWQRPLPPKIPLHGA